MTDTNDTPPQWMRERADSIARHYTEPKDDPAYLKAEIIEAMQEAGREVAFYFAAQERAHKVAVADAYQQAVIDSAKPAGGPLTEFGWLIENGKQAGAGLAYKFIDNDAGGLPGWTTDPLKALRFARRADAEQFAHHDDDAWRIVEHGFHSIAAAPTPAEPAAPVLTKSTLKRIDAAAEVMSEVLANVRLGDLGSKFERALGGLRALQATNPEPASESRCANCGWVAKWNGYHEPASTPSEGAIVDFFDAAVRTVEMSVDRWQAARVVRTLQKQVLAALAPTSPALTDDEIMDAVREFAKDGGRWPSDWIRAARAVLALAGGKT